MQVPASVTARLLNLLAAPARTLQVQAPKAPPAPVPAPGSSDTAVTNPEILQIDYAPYTFVGQPQVTTFTGFLAR